MVKKHYVVIVLGLGEYKNLYIHLTKHWEATYGLTPIIHVFGWREKRANFNEYLTNLEYIIKPLIEQRNSIVSLIGISAGASAALNMYCKLKRDGRPINGKLATLCGRFSFQYHPWYPLSRGVDPFPAFKQSVTLAEKNIRALSRQDKEHIITVHAFFDEVVPKKAASIEGVRAMMIPFLLHFPSIMFTFLFNKKWLVRLLQETD